MVILNSTRRAAVFFNKSSPHTNLVEKVLWHIYVSVKKDKNDENSPVFLKTVQHTLKTHGTLV